MSSGSKPATTTGMRWRSTKRLEDAPAGDRRGVAGGEEALDPRARGISATISITGGMYLCAESTEKLGGGSPRRTAAVATAVVSKPVAKKTTSSSVSARELDRLRDAVDDVDRARRRPARRPATCTVPGTRSMSP